MTRRSPSQYDWEKCSFDETIMTKHFTRQASKDVRFIIIHHMTIPDRDASTDDALDTCWDVWQARRASAQYGIDGRFVRQYVWDKDYAWAAGTEGNRYGISIEHANASLSPDWRIGDETLATSVRLVAALHKLYKMGRPRKDVTVRKHSSFMATACPGPYMDGIWSDYVRRVQAEYDRITGAGGSNAGSSAPAPSKPKKKPKKADFYDPPVKRSVKNIQKIVGVAQDGLYGDGTKAAVAEYQGTTLGVASDGLWGPATEAAYKNRNKGGKLAVDGIFGKNTIKALQREVGVKADGIFGTKSRQALQRWVGVNADSIIGLNTIRALQRKVGARVDGIWGPATTKALQRYLNKH